MTPSKGACFVISPIGEEGTETRVRADQVLNHIIRPAAKELGYEPVIRADEIAEPGLITTQVIQHLIEDPMVIADLTGRNPNVFYELAVRHAIKLPVVQIIAQHEPIPFDVSQARTIPVDYHDLDSVARCRAELAKQMSSAESNPGDADNPISVTLELQSLRGSENPADQRSAEIIELLYTVIARVDAIGDTTRSDGNELSRKLRLPIGDLVDLIPRLEAVAFQIPDDSPEEAEWKSEMDEIISKARAISSYVSGEIGLRHRPRRIFRDNDPPPASPP